MYGGDVHLTIRLADGTLTLTPEWMLRPAAAGFEIRPAPRLSLTRFRDLRAHLDAVLGSPQGDSPPTDGADHAPHSPTTKSVRRAAAPATDPERTPPGDGGSMWSAAMDVGGWLRSLGLDRYEAKFRKNKIDADVLQQLTADDLKDIGVSAVGDRRRLLAAIAALSGQSPIVNTLASSTGW